MFGGFLKISVKLEFKLKDIQSDFIEFVNKNEKIFFFEAVENDSFEKIVEKLMLCFLIKKLQIEIKLTSLYYEHYVRNFFKEDQVPKINDFILICCEKYSTFSLSNNIEQFLNDRIFLNEEKIKSGIVYTPPIIINRILERTLKKDLNSKTIIELIHYKIADLSCGTGAFLLAAMNKLKAHYNSILDSYKVNNELDQLLAKFPGLRNLDLFIIEHNLYGFDIDFFALNLLKIYLYLRITKNLINFQLSYEEFLQKIEKNIINLNIFILDQQKIREILPKFDLIVGNPPYVPWNQIKPYRKVFEKEHYLGCKFDFRPFHGDTQPNLYLFFLIFSLNILRSEGKLGFILPIEWLYHDKVIKIRNYIISQNRDVEIEKFSEKTKIFKVNQSIIGTNSLIIYISEKKNSPVISFSSIKIDESQKIQLSDKISMYTVEFISKPWVLVDERLRSVKKEILSNKNLSYLSETNQFLVKSGFQPPMKKALDYFTLNSNDLKLLNNNEKQHLYPVILNSNEIKEYYIAKLDKYWIVLNDEFGTEQEFQMECPKLYKLLKNKGLKTNKKFWWEFPNIRNLNIYKTKVPKIISPRVSTTNRFALDFNKTIIKGTNSIVISKNLSYFYLLGLFNSKLANFWYQNFGFQYHGDTSRKFEPAKLKKYFLPIINEENELISLFSEVLFKIKIKNLEAFFQIEKKIKQIIDLLIFEHYFKHKIGLNISNYLKTSYSEWLDKLSNLTSDYTAEDLNLIGKFLNKLSNDPSYQEKINHILYNELIQIIE